MKRIAILIAGFAAIAAAQEPATVPKVEGSLNFSLLRQNPGQGGDIFNSPGGSAAFEYNWKRSLGFVADFGGYHNKLDENFNPTTSTYLFGPRYNLRKYSKVTPYAQALFGVGRVSSSLLDPNSGLLNSTNVGFASAFGGGLDVNLSPHVSVKPFEMDYMLTQFSNVWNPETHQNNVRYSAGVVFRFGSK